MLTWLLASATSIAVAATAVAATDAPAPEAAATLKLSAVERTVPDFSLQGTDGRTWSDESLAGKAWVVNFWATWCPPCVEEIPSMNVAYAALVEEGVGMLAINAGEARDAIDAFLAKTPVHFPVVLADALKTLPDWNIRGLPTTLLIDADGQVVFEALGPRDWDDPAMIDFIASLAAEAR